MKVNEILMQTHSKSATSGDWSVTYSVVYREYLENITHQSNTDSEFDTILCSLYSVVVYVGRKCVENGMSVSDLRFIEVDVQDRNLENAEDVALVQEIYRTMKNGHELMYAQVDGNSEGSI